MCFSCYKSHRSIIKQVQSSTCSTDDDLVSRIEGIKSNMCIRSEIRTFEQVVTHAVQVSAIYVGESLLKQTALLLPDVYDSFMSYVMETSQLCNINHENTSTTQPIWLLNQVSSLLDFHLAYKCPVKRFGTVLYRHGGDLVHALSVSLGQSRAHSLQWKVMTVFHSSQT